MLETNTLRSHHDLITIFVSFTASDLNFVVPTRYLLLYRFILYKSLLPRRAKRKKKKREKRPITLPFLVAAIGKGSERRVDDRIVDSKHRKLLSRM